MATKMKMQDGGIKAKAKKVVKTALKASPEYKAYKAVGKAAKGVDDTLEKRYPNYTGKGTMYDGAKQAAKTILGYKTGGMVNSNAQVTAAKKATGKVGGVTKAVSKVAVKTTAPKGRVGGTSTAPKTATPKMKMGGMKKKSC